MFQKLKRAKQPEEAPPNWFAWDAESLLSARPVCDVHPERPSRTVKVPGPGEEPIALCRECDAADRA
jgi:hypothetical protein